jgi:ATP-dependent Clp protease adaptor protein ClpS
MRVKEEIKEQIAIEVDVMEQDPFHLIVWNDDVNTFDWVIESLMEVCSHTYEQAEQCAYIIHYKGKYSVKDGTERGINATVEESVK